MEGSLLAISVLVVLLLVIMPALLLGVGWGVKRYTEKAPAWSGFPVARKSPGNRPGGKTPAGVER
jgi:hypothetical protein